MNSYRQPKTVFTEEEYYRLEEGSELRHEYFEGQLFPMGEYVANGPGSFVLMAGASQRHNDIAVEVLVSLVNQLGDNPCRARMSDQRIKIEATGLQTYPDLVVVCPPFHASPDNADTLTDATVIIEILSRTTASYDRGKKFDHYRQLPSLRHYLLVEQERVEVEHRWRSAESPEWRSETFTEPDQLISLDAIGCGMTLDDIYRRIQFGI